MGAEQLESGLDRNSDQTWWIGNKGGSGELEKPQPPYGPTMLEVVSTCGLRACYSATRAFEQRQSFSAILGSSFHQVLQALPSMFRNSATKEGLAKSAVELFNQTLEERLRHAREQPRSRWIEVDPRRRDLATHAIIAEAHRIFGEESDRFVAHVGPIPTNSERSWRIARELRLESADGLIVGVLDKVTRDGGATVISDFKSAVRSDVPERYIRQLQVYAWLWHQNYGEWPTKAVLIYPFLSAEREVAIDPSECIQVVWRYVSAVIRLLSNDPESTSNPGGICKVCDFRPWCKAFWEMQSRRASMDLSEEQVGIECSLTRISEIKGTCVAWFDSRWGPIKLIFKAERLPHLQSARPGSRIRLLDSLLSGTPLEFKASITERTEVFILQY